MHLTEEQQHIACQMGQSAIALVVLAPTAVNFPTPFSKLLVEPASFGMIGGQGVPLLFIPGHLRLQLINLSAGSCLVAIKSTRVEEKGPAYLFAVFVHGGFRQGCVDAPVCSPPALNAFPGRGPRLLHPNEEVPHPQSFDTPPPRFSPPRS